MALNKRAFQRFKYLNDPKRRSGESNPDGRGHSQMMSDYNLSITAGYGFSHPQYHYATAALLFLVLSSLRNSARIFWIYFQAIGDDSHIHLSNYKRITFFENNSNPFVKSI